MQLEVLKMLTFITIFIYNAYLFNYHSKILKLKFNKKKNMIIFSAVISFISMMIVNNNIFMPWAYIITMISYLIIFFIVFDESFYVISMLISINIFFLIVTRSIIIGVFSFLLSESMMSIENNRFLYILPFLICRVVLIISYICLDKFNLKESLKQILANEASLLPVTVINNVLVIILLNMNYNYYTNDNKIVTILMICNNICLIICLYFSLMIGKKTVEWSEDKLRYKILDLKFEYQKNMYNKKNKYEESLRMYNHDFKNILRNLYMLICNNSIDEAKKILLQSGIQISNIVCENIEYSNKETVSAILNELYKKCKEVGINFNAECFIPNELKLTELEVMKVFSNLSSNAFEACEKQTVDEKRWITFKSYVKDGMFIIFQENSFNKEIIIKKNRLITTKSTGMHGIGIEIIETIVREHKGMVLIKPDKSEGVFQFVIKIPLD